MNIKLSKFMSLILRHEPKKFGLTLDRDGYVPIKDLSSVTKTSIDEIENVVANCPKQRFEIAGNKIRARFGHSVQKINHPRVTPPDVLYHGTSRKAWALIQKQGLLPMGRQHVHLSTDIDACIAVAMRHDTRPVLLTIDAKCASMDGLEFFEAEVRTFLANVVPPKYIAVEYLGENGKRWIG